jgi:hypothetical protein
MSYLMSTVFVPNGSTTALFTLPPGQAKFTFWSGVSTIPVYISTSNHVSPTNGMQVPTIPMDAMENYMSSPGCTFWVANTAATTIPVSYLVTTNA